MNYYVGIQDLVSNALIELFEQNQEKQVTFEEICNYGEAVVKIMTRQKKTAYLALSRTQTNGFIHDCSNILDVVDDRAFKIKDESSIETLKQEFRNEMPFDVLKACIDPESLKALHIYAA